MNALKTRTSPDLTGRFGKTVIAETLNNMCSKPNRKEMPGAQRNGQGIESTEGAVGECLV